MTHDQYFAQDILVRIAQARLALEEAKCDPIVFQDEGVGITVADVLHDVYIAIWRMRGAEPL